MPDDENAWADTGDRISTIVGTPVWHDVLDLLSMPVENAKYALMATQSTDPVVRSRLLERAQTLDTYYRNFLAMVEQAVAASTARRRIGDKDEHTDDRSPQNDGTRDDWGYFGR